MGVGPFVFSRTYVKAVLCVVRPDIMIDAGDMERAESLRRGVWVPRTMLKVSPASVSPELTH